MLAFLNTYDFFFISCNERLIKLDVVNEIFFFLSFNIKLKKTPQNNLNPKQI